MPSLLDGSPVRAKFVLVASPPLCSTCNRSPQVPRKCCSSVEQRRKGQRKLPCKRCHSTPLKAKMGFGVVGPRPSTFPGPSANRPPNHPRPLVTHMRRKTADQLAIATPRKYDRKTHPAAGRSSLTSMEENTHKDLPTFPIPLSLNPLKLPLHVPLVLNASTPPPTPTINTLPQPLGQHTSQVRPTTRAALTPLIAMSSRCGRSGLSIILDLIEVVERAFGRK